MDLDQLIAAVTGLDGVLDLAPSAGSGFPEIAWGDHFFYYAPDGQVPQREQPFATIVTKDYPGDDCSGLDAPGRWRLNIHVGRQAFVELVGEEPDDASEWDVSAADTVFPHPVYRSQGWISIINPGPATSELAVGLLTRAHADAGRRSGRRRRGAQPPV